MTEVETEYESWLAAEGLLDLDHAGSLQYPCLASAFLDYYATGEGRTVGMLVTNVDSATDLREAVEQAWGSYFCRGVLVRPWSGVPDRFALLNAHAVDLVMCSSAWPCRLKFLSTLHFNAA